MITPDPRTPFVVDVRALVGRPGRYERLTLDGPAGPDVSTDVVAVADEAPAELELLLESVQEGILVTGSVSAEGQADCSRCLDRIDVPLTADVQELFVWSQSEAVPDENGERPPFLVGDLMDLRQVVHDSLVLEMPLAPLCSDDCPGLCQTCGARLAEDPQHHHEEVDPRWAALADVRDRLLDGQSTTHEEK